jgi:hypothetical protein
MTEANHQHEERTAMATMNYPQLDTLRRRIAAQHGRLILWKLRDMRRTRRRSRRLPKEERALKALIADARAADLGSLQPTRRVRLD